MAEQLAEGEFIAKTVQDRAKKDRHQNDVYSCELEDRQGISYEDVYVARKKPLAQGDQLYGRVENNEYGYRFFAMQREDTAPTNRPSASGGNRAKSGSSDSSIESQVAFKGAIEFGRTLTEKGETVSSDHIVAMTKKFATAIREAAS